MLFGNVPMADFPMKNLVTASRNLARRGPCSAHPAAVFRWVFGRKQGKNGGKMILNISKMMETKILRLGELEFIL